MLTDISRYISAQNAAKLQSEVTSARIKEEFPIEEELAKATLPAPKAKGVKREQEDAEDSDSELREEDFTFDLPMPKLYAHFKKLKADIAELAPAAELTARVETLERNITELWGVPFSMRGAYTNIETLVQRMNCLGEQLEKMERRIEKLEKK